MSPRWRNGAGEPSPEHPGEDVDGEEEGFSEGAEDAGDDVGVV